MEPTTARPVPFEHVVDEHGPTVWRVCRAVAGPVDADDAWSATFLSALGAYDRLRPGSDVRAWLVTIAHRRAVDVVRARGRRPVPVGDAPERATADRPPSEERDPALWAALDGLPSRQRATVALHHVAGLPHAEVGELLGCSPEAARRAASDGIAALRRQLRSEGTAP